VSKAVRGWCPANPKRNADNLQGWPHHTPAPFRADYCGSAAACYSEVKLTRPWVERSSVLVYQLTIWLTVKFDTNRGVSRRGRLTNSWYAKRLARSVVSAAHQLFIHTHHPFSPAHHLRVRRALFPISDQRLRVSHLFRRWIWHYCQQTSRVVRNAATFNAGRPQEIGSDESIEICVHNGCD
jgi:hypothetical protein